MRLPAPLFAIIGAYDGLHTGVRTHAHTAAYSRSSALPAAADLIRAVAEAPAVPSATSDGGAGGWNGFACAGAAGGAEETHRVADTLMARLQVCACMRGCVYAWACLCSCAGRCAPRARVLVGFSECVSTV